VTARRADRLGDCGNWSKAVAEPPHSKSSWRIDGWLGLRIRACEVRSTNRLGRFAGGFESGGIYALDQEPEHGGEFAEFGEHGDAVYYVYVGGDEEGGEADGNQGEAVEDEPDTQEAR